MSGRPRSSTIRSGRSPSTLGQRVAGGAGHGDLVASRPQQRHHRPLNRDLVVDEEDVRRAAHDGVLVERGFPA